MKYDDINNNILNIIMIMPQYLIYKGRKCGSTARGAGIWTKEELIIEAQRYNISIDGTLTDICQRLIDRETKQASSQEHKSNNVKKYVNDTTLLGDSCEDYDDDELIQDKYGYGYTPEELINTLVNTKRNTNPYTNQPLWKDRNEFNILMEHPKISSEVKYRLISIFFPIFDPDIIQLVQEYPDIFDLIGYTGCVLKSDFGKDFKGSQSMLAELLKELETLPDNIRKQFETLRTIDGRKTLKDIMTSSNNECIHGVGSYLLGIYLYIWFNIPENVRAPLIPVLYQGGVRTTIVLGYFDTTGNILDIMLFKFETDIGKILMINFKEFNIARNRWFPADGYVYAVDYIPADILAVIEEDINNNIDEIILHYGYLQDYLSCKNLECVL